MDVLVVLGAILMLLVPVHWLLQFNQLEEIKEMLRKIDRLPSEEDEDMN